MIMTEKESKYPKVVEGKDPTRIPSHYLKYPNEWIAEYDMLLPDGKTCNDCAHVKRCTKIFGQNANATYCQFYPSRASIKPHNHHNQ